MSTIPEWYEIERVVRNFIRVDAILVNTLYNEKKNHFPSGDYEGARRALRGAIHAKHSGDDDEWVSEWLKYDATIRRCVKYILDNYGGIDFEKEKPKEPPKHERKDAAYFLRHRKELESRQYIIEQGVSTDAELKKREPYTKADKTFIMLRYRKQRRKKNINTIYSEYNSFALARGEKYRSKEGISMLIKREKKKHRRKK